MLCWLPAVAMMMTPPQLPPPFRAPRRQPAPRPTRRRRLRPQRQRLKGKVPQSWSTLERRQMGSAASCARGGCCRWRSRAALPPRAATAPSRRRESAPGAWAVEISRAAKASARSIFPPLPARRTTMGRRIVENLSSRSHFFASKVSTAHAPSCPAPAASRPARGGSWPRRRARSRRAGVAAAVAPPVRPAPWHRKIRMRNAAGAAVRRMRRGRR